MKKASFTKIQRRNWIRQVGRLRFLVLFVCLFAGLHGVINAQNFTDSKTHPLKFDSDNIYTPSADFIKLATCGEEKIEYTDDNFNDPGLYYDNTARLDTFQICPQNRWQRAVVTFASFDLAPGDVLLAYQGNIEALNADQSPVFEEARGFAVSNAFGGWIGADCDPSINNSGCLTFIFQTNGDNNKGTGWEAQITCDDNPIQISAPNIQSVKLDCPAPTADQLNWAKGWIDFPYPSVEGDCQIASDPSKFILIVKNSNGKVCHRSGPSGSASTDANRLYGADFAIGVYTAEYKLADDTIKTTGPIVFSVQGPSLTCNDDINVAFGSACMIQLQPDDILENTCAPSPVMQYHMSVTLGSGKNRKVLTTQVETSNTPILTGSGSFAGVTLTHPIITKEIIEEAGLSACGGQAEVTIERVYYEYLDDIDAYVPCNSGIQRDRCSSTISFSDFTAPIVNLVSDIDTLVACSELEVDSLINYFIIDNCDKDATVTFDVAFEETDDCFGRNGDPGVTNAVVTFIASDQCGNTSTTVDNIVFIRPSVAVDPDIFVVPSSIQLQCDASNAPTEEALPGIKTGFIKNGSFVVTDTMELSESEYTCGYILTKEVQEIPQTDCGRKQIYTWQAIDWCDSSTGPIVLGNQFVEYTDTIAPQFTGVGSDPIEVNLGHFECTFNGTNFTPPAANDNCNLPIVRLDAILLIEDDSTRWSVPSADWATLTCNSYELRWIAEDPCHTQSKTDTLIQLVHVRDVTKPSVVTTDELIVSVPNDWGAIINVEDVDEGSYDACGISLREIRRDDEPEGWGQTATITCSDIGNIVRLHLRVTDIKGNQNTAWMNIRAEDRIAAVCNDLPALTLDCSEMHGGTDFAPSTDVDQDGEFEESEWTPLSGELLTNFQEQFGTFDCSDNLSCTKLTGPENSEEEYQLISLQCGQFEIRRRFRLKESGFHAVSGSTGGSAVNINSWAHQEIHVASESDWTVTLPADVIGTCNDDITKVTDPIFRSSSCDVIAWEVEDKVFNVPGDACMKIERTYHVINWCKYSVGDAQVQMSRIEASNGNVTEPRIVAANSTTNANVGYFTYIQILKIQDDEAPVVTVHNPEDPCINAVDFDALPFGEEDNTPGTAPFECDENKTWSATATDCSTTESMTWIGRLYDEAGNLIKEVNTNTLTYAVSNKQKYYAEFWAYDGCGNSGGAIGDTMEFWDCKAPTAYFLNGVSLSLASNGTVEFWGSDVDRGSFDNCADQSELEFYILDPLSDTPQPTIYEDVIKLPQAITYDCIRVGNQAITVYVVDPEGNYDFATTTISIQDNAKICEGLFEEQSKKSLIAGSIHTVAGKMVENVTVKVNEGMTSSTTGTDGTFQFALENGDNYTITSEKNNDALNGVSTFDLVLINKHILGIATLDSPYKQIAADVNQSGTITAFDMVQLRRLILNISTSFPNSDSWRFVDASFEFSDTPLTDDFNEFRSINDLKSNMMYNDFIAIKIGDVNESAIANSLATVTSRNSNKTLLLQTQDRYVTEGDRIAIDINTTDLDQIQGYQFSMNHNGLELMNIEDGLATADNFNTNWRHTITTSWNKTNQTNQTNQNSTLFTLNFVATTSGQLSNLLSISSDITTIEAYDETGNIMDISLEFTSDNAGLGFELNQNTPNPFRGETVIGFTLPTASSATLKVINAQGKVLKSIDGMYQKGYNSITLNAKELRTTGVVYYRLETIDKVASKKMLIIE